MLLTSHFSLEEMVASEYAARHGIDNTPSASVQAALKFTAQNLERVRNLLGVPLHVTSGYRSPALNAAIGGAPSSAHCLGYAADFIPRQGTTMWAASEIARGGIHFDQLILEYGWVHISFDPRLRGELLTKRSAASPYEQGLNS